MKLTSNAQACTPSQADWETGRKAMESEVRGFSFKSYNVSQEVLDQVFLKKEVIVIYFLDKKRNYAMMSERHETNAKKGRMN